jgi:hypothetical protein
MQHSPPWEANDRTADQRSPHSLCKPKVYYSLLQKHSTGHYDKTYESNILSREPSLGRERVCTPLFLDTSWLHLATSPPNYGLFSNRPARVAQTFQEWLRLDKNVVEFTSCTAELSLIAILSLEAAYGVRVWRNGTYGETVKILVGSKRKDK